jgi:hypothetical protein
VCFAFSLPPTPFIRQLNRATAETAQEAALAEGLAPLQGWVKRLADDVIQDRLGHPDLQFAWVESQAADPAEQAKVLETYVTTGIYTIDEARAQLGWTDPVATRCRHPIANATAFPSPRDRQPRTIDMARKTEGNPACEIAVTPEMVEAGYVVYLAERPRVEDGDEEDRRIAFTAIFCAMLQARGST